MKIGKTIEPIEKRLVLANKPNAFMCGRWYVTQKVKTNVVDRTEKLAHELFKDYLDKESMSSEMFSIPENMTVKQMADRVRNKDKKYKEVIEQEKKLEEELREKKEEYAAIVEENKAAIFDIPKKD